ncbi:MAG: DUF1778 domain-containing protein [Desulfobacteraceae bacterium]|jgi:uncharacterized protein (DUF1778 family)
MSAQKSIKRLFARIPVNVYTAIAQAAELVGSMMNQFLVQSALEKASSIIEKEQRIDLSLKSAEVFFDALTNPPEPPPTLVKAIKNYDKTMKN